MDNMIQNEQYTAIIKKIKTVRLISGILYFVVLVISMYFCLPSVVEIGNEVISENRGAHPFITFLVFIFISFIYLIVTAINYAPITKAMDEEANPYKYLALATPFYKKNIDRIYSVAYFFMGNFLGARFYSEKLSQSKKAKIKLSGLFNKACCEFFLNDVEAFKNTAMQFKIALCKDKLSKKYRKIFENNIKYLDLMAAFSENNIEQIALCQNLVSIAKSKASRGFTNYLNGIAAYILGDREKAIYYFMAVKTECSKTFFPPLCDEYLERLK